MTVPGTVMQLGQDGAGKHYPIPATSSIVAHSLDIIYLRISGASVVRKPSVPVIVGITHAETLTPNFGIWLCGTDSCATVGY